MAAADLLLGRAPEANAPGETLAASLARLDTSELRRDFVQQGSFLYLDQFLPPDTVAALISAVGAVENRINRNYLPVHKRGGSASRHTIDELAPAIGALYRSSE